MQSVQNIFLLLRDSEFPVSTLSRYLCGSRRLMVLPQPLPRPNEIKERPDLIRRRYDGIGVLRQILSFKKYDTPTASIYRMYEFLCADESNELMLEVQYFWRHSSDLWRLETFPNPHDVDKERYAILASIVESLTHAFNFRLEMGLRRGTSEQTEESCPPWTSRVPPLERPLDLRRHGASEFPESPSNPFTDRQIGANAGNIFSI